MKPSLGNVNRHNRLAWDHQVEVGNRWTIPVNQTDIDLARRGTPAVKLTPTRHVPDDWLASVHGNNVLCLASGGGQQAPLLSAAGATVTVLDNSPRQLQQDRLTARQYDLKLETVEGDMTEAFPFRDGIFDLIVHPCSNGFVESILPVWRECARVLRLGGTLLAGFTNPLRYLFDEESDDPLQVRHCIPYADLVQRDAALLNAQLAAQEPVEFGHSLTDQLGGQLAAGFVIDGFYEDRYEQGDPLSERIDSFIATRASRR